MSEFCTHIFIYNTTQGDKEYSDRFSVGLSFRMCTKCGLNQKCHYGDVEWENFEQPSEEYIINNADSINFDFMVFFKPRYSKKFFKRMKSKLKNSIIIDFI